MDGKKKVLIAEDEPDLLQIVSVRIELGGYDVLKAEDGEEALQKIKDEKPDLVLLDMMLPKIDGFEICRMVKFDEATKAIPIIVLSALSEQKDREKAIECGADAYFIKPFDLALLVTKIKSYLG